MSNPNLSTAPDQTEVSPLDMALGILTFNQAAAAMAQYFPRNSDSGLLLNRLIARGSIAATQFAGQMRLKLEELATFLRAGAANADARKALGLPPETLLPLFGTDAHWFGNPWAFQMSQFETNVFGEIDKQIPKNAIGMTFNNSWDAVAIISLQTTPTLQKLFASPVPQGNSALPLPDGSIATSLAELFLASRLQFYAEKVIYTTSQSDPSNIKPIGIRPLYSSSSSYKSIAEAAIAMFEASTYFKMTRMLSRNDPTKGDTMFEAASITVSLSNKAAVQLAGTNMARLACLAF